jgi:hypothetical protein
MALFITANPFAHQEDVRIESGHDDMGKWLL